MASKIDSHLVIHQSVGLDAAVAPRVAVPPLRGEGHEVVVAAVAAAAAVAAGWALRLLTRFLLEEQLPVAPALVALL